MMERLLDEISFDAPEITGKSMVIDATYVKEKLKDFVEDEDLSRYIL
jgi:ATP-dependent HslUV protease ATP-binding subunit HslU